MGYLDKLTKKGVVSHVVKTVEYGAASYAFGYVQSRYRDKARILGVPVDLAVGVAAKSAVLVGEILGKTVPGASHMDVIGNAGIGAYFHTLGAGHGASAAGIKRVLVSEKDLPKVKALLPDATVLGAIPKAPQGDFLSPAELAALAQRR